LQVDGGERWMAKGEGRSSRYNNSRTKNLQRATVVGGVRVIEDDSHSSIWNSIIETCIFPDGEEEKLSS
jgi:hypothetical protein